MKGPVWSFRVVRQEADHLALEGRAGHLTWEFIAVYSHDVRIGLGPCWAIECNGAELARGRGIPSLPMAVALVVESVAPYLTEVRV